MRVWSLVFPLFQLRLHQTLDTLYEYVPMELLPRDYLPDDYDGQSPGTVDEICSKSSDNR